MLYGECDFLLSYYSEQVLVALGDKDEIRKVYYEEFDYKQIKSYLMQMSLFGGNNILYLQAEKGVSKKEIEALVKICHENSGAFFVFDFRGDAKRSKELSTIFKAKVDANFVRFFKPNFSEAIGFLSEQAKKISLECDHYALSHLYKIQSENLSLAYNELQKLTILDKKITSREIDAFVFGLSNVDTSAFIKKLFSKADIKSDLERMIESGVVGEVEIINSIQAHVVTLFQFLCYIKTYGEFNALEIVGYPLPKFIAEEYARSCYKLKPTQYNMILTHLINVEMKLKEGGHMDKTAYLFSALIKLQTLL